MGITMNIIMYTKAHCPNCTSAKLILDAQQLNFIERSVDEPEWREVFTRQFPDIRQMPQIFIEGQRVGGLAGLQAALKQVGKC
jgi:glutaredoxin 3